MAAEADMEGVEEALCEVSWEPESRPQAPEGHSFRARKWLGLSFAAVASIGLLWVAVFQVGPAKDGAVPPKVSETSLAVANKMGVQELLELFDLDGLTSELQGSNNSFVKEIFDIKRNLQDMTQNPLALPIATCTVDVYLAASFIGIIGNVVNGAVKACERKDTYRNFVTADRFVDLLKIDFLDERKRQAIKKLLDQGCRIGVESSFALFSFTAAFLARAASDCAMSMKLPPNPTAQCAGALSLVGSGISYMAAGAEIAEATCPPYPGLRDQRARKDLVDVSALDIVGGVARRLVDTVDNPVAQAKLDDARQIVLSRLPSLGKLGGFILNNREWLKIRREKRKAKSRKEKEIKCGFDIAGLVGFAAAVGVFITAGTVECPLASGETAAAENFKMGCSLDISAVVAALTTIGGFVGILAVECPEDPKNAADKLCSTGALNIVSSMGFLSGALSDVIPPAEEQDDEPPIVIDAGQSG
ncbi:unnamed protein product [Symbiodinium sp. CCMP2592]|nr:unnamed protein product [Symbiodinium sp. CCMP2592]